MKFLRAFFLGREITDLLLEARQVIRMQKQVILQQEVDATRAHLNVLLGWRLSQEMPEIDYRDELDAAIVDLHDQVARLEEHVT